MTRLPAGSRLGVMGGGQLGRMFVHAAQTLGFKVTVLDPDPDSPAGAVADRHLRAAYLDPAALDDLASSCAAVTTEFENVPAPALARLAAGCLVAPAAEAVAIAQNRLREKACFAGCGIDVAPHVRIADAGELDAASRSGDWPAILKTASLGYDGKGQRAVESADDLDPAWSGLGRVECVLERRLELASELSVIVARGRDGQMVDFPVQRNWHRDGILFMTAAGGADTGPAGSAIEAARRIAEAIAYVGVLCIEFFVLADGRMVANEMAPRPHNSGHWTIDGCDHSQFEMQVRTLAGWPLARPRQHSSALMLNLLGDLWFDGRTRREPDWASVVAEPGAHLHLYGKAEPRRGRKMGHLTLTGTDIAGLHERADRIASRLGLPALPRIA